MHIPNAAALPAAERSNVEIDGTQTVAEQPFSTIGQVHNEQIHSEVFENASDCFHVFEVTTGGRFKLEAVNRAAEKMSRRSRAQIVGQYLEDTTTSEALTALILAKFHECIASRLPVCWQGRYDLLVGQLHLESSVIPLCNSEGRVHRIVAVARDITERARMQDALRQSEQRSREVFEKSSDTIFLLDVTDDGRFRVSAANPAVERATGWRDDEIRGKYLDELVSDRVLQQLVQNHRRCIESNSIVEFELETNPPAGHRWFATTVIPLRDSVGHVARLMTVSRDVTERKQAEQLLRGVNEELERRVAERTLALLQSNKILEQEIQERKHTQAMLAQQSEQLAFANAELEAFSYSLSHDLRAPLRIIDGFTRMLCESCEAKLDTDGQEYLRRVKASTLRMNLLIDDMLKLFRMSRHEMRRIPLDLSELTQQIVAELERTQPDRRVTVCIEPNLNTSADASLMRIALENMLSNAWKFTCNTADARIEFGCMQQGGTPSYFVRDNGAGFPMSQADKLFVPFQRLHTQGEFEGTGIGLTIVQRVIDRHGGRVWVDSRVNQGTTVYFELGSASSSY